MTISQRARYTPGMAQLISPADVEGFRPDVPAWITDREIVDADQQAARVVTGLIETIESRAGARDISLRLGVSLLVAGKPRASAALAMGMMPRAFEARCKGDSQFGQLCDFAHAWGTSRYEVELHDRALAGTLDRGSARALEVVNKRYNPEYRDKAAMEITHILASQEARSSALAGLPLEVAEDAE